jgi:CBS domain-containing protein
MKVRDLMEIDVHSCEPQSDLQAVAILMWNKNCGSVAVVDSKGKPIGMITDRDIAMGAAINHKPLWELTAGEISSHRKVFTCAVEDSIHIALEVMRNNKIRRLPVVDKNGLLAGILSIDKLINIAQPRSHSEDELAFNEVMTSLKNICSPRRAA